MVWVPWQKQAGSSRAGGKALLAATVQQARRQAMIQSLLREKGQKRGALTWRLGLVVRLVGGGEAMTVGKAGSAQGKALGKRGKAAAVCGIGWA